MSLVQPQEGELKLNGLRIHHFHWQGRGQRPLILLHGLRDHAYYWQDCANRLLNEFSEERQSVVQALAAAPAIRSLESALAVEQSSFVDTSPRSESMFYANTVARVF